MKLTSLLNAFKLITFDRGMLFCRYVPAVFMGGGPSSTTSNVNQSSIPSYLKPQVMGMLAGASKQLFQTDAKGNITGVNPYVPYSTNPTDYVAGFSPMQQQSFAQAANIRVPGQYQGASNFASTAGMGGLGSAQQALGYGGMGAGYGQRATNLAGNALGYGQAGAGYGNIASKLGLQGLQAQQYGRGIGNQAQNYAAQSAAAGQQYGRAVTNPNTVNAYMSPYQQNVTNVQKQAALRDFQQAQTMRQANAAKSSAYGGSRQAIENAEAQRNLNSQLQSIEAQGQQNAYNQAISNIGQQQNYAIQGLQGAQQGLGTALQGGQLGLSGIGQAISGQNAAMQGAQIGLGGVGAANQAYQTGIQGANAGLQGVQGAQAGYGLANTVGQNLSNIGTQQLAAQRDIIGLQNQMGGQQQNQQQQIINQAVQNYANAQQNPMNALSSYNALLRGYSTPTTNTTSYTSVNPTQQAIGVGGSLATLASMAGKKTGGVIKAYKSGGLVDLAVSNALEGV